MIIQVIGSFAMVINLVALFIMARKNYRAGWMLQIVCNILWLISNIKLGFVPGYLMGAFSTAISIYGLYKVLKMQVKFNEKTGKVEFAMSDKDIQDAKEISMMMDSEGWKILCKYYEVAREEITDSGKKGVRSRAKRELSSEKWAMLDGFDQAVIIPNKLTSEMKDYLEKIKQEESDDDERRKDDGNG